MWCVGGVPPLPAHRAALSSSKIDSIPLNTFTKYLCRIGRAGVLFACLLTAVSAGAQSPSDFYVTNVGELNGAVDATRPGDVITMANGIWSDAFIFFETDGVEGDSIRLQAETPGEVILDGMSVLRIAGDYLVVDGLRFEGGAIPTGHVIQFRNGSNHANHSRLTNSTVVDYNPPSDATEYKWVSVYGRHNRVDHNFFAGKTHDGTTLVVWLDDPPNDAPVHHRIDHNHFGHRPVLGKNGGETIRIGTSHRSMQDANVTVEYNLFHENDGEAEIISNKSGDNVFRYNTFLESGGALTLRHGNGALVEGNFFIGRGKRDSGGVRIIGEDHVVINNYFESLDGSSMKTALTIMNGVPNSPLNRYFQVKNAVVAFNTFVNNRYNIYLGAGADSERTLPPENVAFANNVVLSDGRKDIVRQADAPVDMTWTGNVMYGGDLGIEDPGGIAFVDPMLAEADDGLWRPESGSPLIDAAVEEFPAVKFDVDGQEREDVRDIGADEVRPTPIERHPLTAADVGPTWRAATAAASIEQLPRSFKLGQNYPNPFNPSTTIPFRLDHSSRVALRVYDVLGREVAVLVDGFLKAGEHAFEFDATGLASGTYVYVLETPRGKSGNSMVLFK